MKKSRKQSNLKRWSLIAVKGIVILFAVYGFLMFLEPVFGFTPDDAKISSETASIKPTAKDWLKAVNAERKKAGVPPLKLDKRLNASAQKKANELNKEGLDSDPHVNDKGVHGYTYAYKNTGCYNVSENISVDFIDIADAVEGWMQSPAHRKAMLDPKYELTGFGLAGNYTVQHFADC